MLLLSSYGLYLFVSVSITVWVAQTLHKNGRAFLLEAFHQNMSLADSVNRLLVVGFYLLNLGYVSLMLRLSVRPKNVGHAVELLSQKLGLVLVSLGIFHLLNLYLFSRILRSKTATA